MSRSGNIIAGIALIILGLIFLGLTLMFLRSLAPVSFIYIIGSFLIMLGCIIFGFILLFKKPAQTLA